MAQILHEKKLLCKSFLHGMLEAQQLLESEVKTKSKPQPTTTVQDCQFYGVKWDAQAVSAIQTVADGLVANAQALGKLAEVFKSQNINVECLMKIEGK